jgi:gamma-glutamyltranspeptidase/glutathione hydrolase
MRKVLVLLLLGFTGAAPARDDPIHSGRDRVHAAFAEHGMVATQESVATRVGVDVLRAGGNAVDAAVAVGFALAVTLPRAGNLGGGGFMLVHHAASGETHAVDYRETAPAAAHRDLFLNAAGGVDRARARFSHASAGVPGTVAGLTLALERFGTLPLERVIAPAVALARDGVEVTWALADSLAARAERLGRNPAARRIFLNPDGGPLEAGDRLVQTDLAGTLERIAEGGAGGFYTGETSRLIAEDMAAHGGLITGADLAAYTAKLRSPVRGRYRDVEVASMPPPSSGGVHLVQMLNVLEGFPIGFLGHNTADTVHLMAETMKLAYADRSKHLGDADFVPVPVSGLTSRSYAARLRRGIDLQRARPASGIARGDPGAAESPDTTHFSIMDSAGNVVSNTYTINFSYGSGIVAAGTGILLNNEMDDFSAKPGVPNAYGLLGGDANAIAPGKRPLSSMTPTIVFRGGEPLLATGSPGGSRIITTTLQVILNVVDHGMGVASAVTAPRVHHPWMPDELRVERGLSLDTLALLRARGHKIVERNAMGSANSVMRVPGGFLGFADPRRRGALAAGW